MSPAPRRATVKLWRPATGLAVGLSLRLKRCHLPFRVIAGLDPATQSHRRDGAIFWVAGPSPAMTHWSNAGSRDCAVGDRGLFNSLLATHLSRPPKISLDFLCHLFLYYFRLRSPEGPSGWDQTGARGGPAGLLATRPKETRGSLNSAPVRHYDRTARNSALRIASAIRSARDRGF